MSVAESDVENNKSLEEKNLELYSNKHLRWNYVFNFLDGSFFWLGYAFIAPSVILPIFISHFTDNKFLIGLIAMIGASGWFLPQIFTSHWVEKMPVKKDAPVKLGFLTERIPIFLMPFSAMISLINPILAISSFFIFWIWHSFGAGIVAVAWQDMIAKVIPVKSRGVFMGVTTLAGNAMGIIGAILAAKLLDLFIFPRGYVINFSIAAVLIFFSWIFIALVREYPLRNPDQTSPDQHYMIRIIELIKDDRNFSWFLICQVIGSLGGMAWGFIAVYASQMWALSDGQTGTFSIWLLAGQSIGNIIGGLAGDRFGYKRVILFGFFFVILAQFLVLFAPSPQWISAVFFLRGISLGSLWLASLMVLEFSRPEIRPTYIGINNTLLGISSMIAPIIGGWIAQSSGYPVLFLSSMVISSLAFMLFISRVHDPRRV
jgi:MFS family permease